MTSVEAAVIILKEYNKPATAKELATEILRREMVHSNAKDRSTSIAATILKAISNYNDMEMPLCYWNKVSRNRLIGLKEWKKNDLKLDIEEDENTNTTKHNIEEKSTIILPKGIIDKLQFTYQCNIKDSFEEYVVYILELGLQASKEETKEAFIRRIKEIYDK